MSEPLSFHPRPHPDAGVAVMIMSHNQGTFAATALDSALAQELPGLELLMVDHASSDGSSAAQAQAAAEERGVAFLAMERHASVGRARNAAIAATTAELVLPLDADNVLLPGALAYMRELLCTAPDDVGFVFPRLLHFNDGAEWETPIPDYNLYLLMLSNYCDTGGLWDRRCFDPGPGFPVADFHEDWALVLELGRRGVHGLAASRPTLRMRRQGFTRSQRATLDPGYGRFMARAVPDLFEPGRFAAEKRRWAPALSLVVAGERAELAPLAERQTCSDFELVTAEAPTPADRLAAGAAAARGGLRLFAAEGAAELLRRAELVEAAIRAFAGNPESLAVLIELGEYHPWRPLEFADLDALGAVCVRSDAGALALEPVELSGDPLREMAAAVIASGMRVEARGWPGAAPAPGPDAAPAQPVSAQLVERPATPSGMRELRLRLETPPLLPGAPAGVDALPPQRRERRGPHQMIQLLRFVEPATGRRRVGTYAQRAQGALEAELGWLSMRPHEGTQPLGLSGDGLLSVCERAEDAVGHAESVDLTGMDELFVARDPEIGACVVSSQEDRGARGAVMETSLGWVEPPHTYPPHPRGQPLRNGRLAVARHLAPGGHRYSLNGSPEDAELELGLLLDAGGRGRVALHPVSADGELAGLAADGDLPARRTMRGLRGIAWSGAPLRPKRYRHLPSRVALGGWRLRHGPRMVMQGVRLDAEPAAWVWRDPGPGRVALYGVWHPVTADRLLTLDPWEALMLGYGQPGLMGHVESTGPHRWGNLALDRPWAFRGGHLFSQ